MFRLAFPAVLFFFAYVVVSSQAFAGPANSLKKSGPVVYTGTFLTKDKSSTHGYPDGTEVVMQPTFLAQQLSDGRLRFLVFSQSGGIHNDHIASLESTVKLHNGRASFKRGTYVLNIQFRPGEVALTESGDPMDGGGGEGSGVTGLYLLKSKAPPNFSRAEREWDLESPQSK